MIGPLQWYYNGRAFGGESLFRGYSTLRRQRLESHGKGKNMCLCVEPCLNGKAFGGESLFRGYSTQRSQPAGRHASAVSSEGALRLCLAGSVACASEFKPLARPECAREREPRERGLGLRVPVCVCAVIALRVPLLASSDQHNGHL